jgi:FAD/FMN-containing dehydrogenase
MRLEPASREQLAEQLASAFAGSRNIESVDLSRLGKLVEYAPEDMVVSVEGGMTLAELQKVLIARKQWLPIDPPSPERLSIAQVLSWNLNGPRRYGYGTIRDYLIGIKVCLSEGQIIKAGGKVVKNVAGYDLCKLFVGSRDTLGVIVEATFKVLPLPESEVCLRAQVQLLREAETLLNQIVASKLRPMVMDLHNLSGAFEVVISLAGTTEDVDFQRPIARALGFTEETTFEYDSRFSGKGSFQKISCLPSETICRIERSEAKEFVARAGNGVIYYRGENVPAPEPLPEKLLARVKAAYDPRNILPQWNP